MLKFWNYKSYLKYSLYLLIWIFSIASIWIETLDFRIEKTLDKIEYDRYLNFYTYFKELKPDLWINIYKSGLTIDYEVFSKNQKEWLFYLIKNYWTPEKYAEINMNYLVEKYWERLEIQNPNLQKKLEENFFSSVKIKNISWKNFYFIQKISEILPVDTFTFSFKNFEEDYYKILNNLDKNLPIKWISFEFQDNLKWENIFLKTFEEIKKLKKYKIFYFNFKIKNEFLDSYILSKKELDLIHSFWSWKVISLNLDIHSDSDKNLPKNYFEQIEKNPVTGWYYLYKRFSWYRWEWFRKINH